MRYYLGEIFITHTKLWGLFYVSSPVKFSTTLIEASDLGEAQKKANAWGEMRIKEMQIKCKWKAFATPAI